MLYSDTFDKVAAFIKSTINFTPGRIVDIGGGTGTLLSMLKNIYPESTTVLVEPSPKMLERAQSLPIKPDEAINMDGDQFVESYRQRDLDLVILQCCIHFFHDLGRFFKRIKKFMTD